MNSSLELSNYLKSDMYIRITWRHNISKTDAVDEQRVSLPVYCVSPFDLEWQNLVGGECGLEPGGGDSANCWIIHWFFTSVISHWDCHSRPGNISQQTVTTPARPLSSVWRSNIAKCPSYSTRIINCPINYWLVFKKSVDKGPSSRLPSLPPHYLLSCLYNSSWDWMWPEVLQTSDLNFFFSYSEFIGYDMSLPGNW